MSTSAKEFYRVEFPDFYPTQAVADHDIFMSFDDDHDAAMFYEWWEFEGNSLFADYLERERS